MIPSISELHLVNSNLTMWQMKIVLHRAHFLSLMLMLVFGVELVYYVDIESDFALYLAEITEIRQFIRYGLRFLVSNCCLLCS